MNIFACYPSAKVDRATACRNAWWGMGYKVGIFFDKGAPQCQADFIIEGKYSGYWQAANRLAQYAVMAHDADIVVLIGDDMSPDPFKRAEDIGQEYAEHFPNFFGVMQPTGDLQGIDDSGRCAAARICGSGWYGKEWIMRAYNGAGPTFSIYYHFYADEEVQLVAERLGAYWQRPDLTQKHDHWSWGHTPRQPYHEKAQTHWANDQKLFNQRLKDGFPYSEPIV